MERDGLETEYGAQENGEESLHEALPRRRVGFFFDDEPTEKTVAAEQVSETTPSAPLTDEIEPEILLAPLASEEEKRLTVRVVRSGVLREIPLVRVARIVRKQKSAPAEAAPLFSVE